MSGTYWSVGDKVNIKQSDIEIKCEGADEFEENQVVGIFIPPSVSLYSGKDTTLNFDVLIEHDTTSATELPTKLVLDSITGANGLFSKCVVYAGNRTQVIETLDHYSSFVSVKYSYDTNDSMRSRRAVVEGCGEWLPSSRGTLGTSKSVQANQMYSPFMEQANRELPPTTTLDASNKPGFIKASVSIPIHMGMFANNSKAVPNVLLNGTYIEFTCESNARVLRVLDSTASVRRLALNPVFSGVDTAGTGFLATDVATASISNPGAGYTATTTFTVATTGGTGSGATFDITSDGTGVITTIAIKTAGSGYTAGDTLTCANVGSATTDCEIDVDTVGATSTSLFTTGQNSQLNPQHSPFQIGQELACVNLSNGDEATFTPPLVIDSIQDGGTGMDHPVKYGFTACQSDKDITSTLAGVDKVSISNVGAGYTPNTVFKAVAQQGATTPAGGTGATFNVYTDGGGDVVSVVVVDPGSGYAPDNLITLATGTGGATTDAVIKVESVVSVPEWVLIAKQGALTTPKYKLSKVRLVVRQLEVPGYEQSVIKKMKSGGQILYDVPSVACVIGSATKGELQTALSIPCEHAKARSIISMPTDNDKIYTMAENVDSDSTYLIDTLEFNPKSSTQGVDHFSDRSAVSGIGDFLTSYNYIIDQKIVPSRKVSTAKSSSRDKGMNMDHIIELEKSINQSHGMVARCFSSFKSNFLLGRALTLDENTIYDGRGKDIRLVCRYEEATTPQKNKLWKHFISHTKTLQIEGANINVMQ